MAVARAKLVRAGWFVILAASGLPVLAAVPAYSLDPAKSVLEFSFMQAGALNKGHFPKLTVKLALADDNAGVSQLDVAVDITAVDTGDKDRDGTLRSTDLFDVAKFPQATFTAVKLSRSSAGHYLADGNLTIRGVSRPLHLPLDLRTATEQGHNVAYLTGKTSLKRLDFGVGQGEWKSTEWVGNDVGVSFNLRLVAPPG